MKLKQKLVNFFTVILTFVLLFSSVINLFQNNYKIKPAYAQTANDWPMAGANPQRTSWTPEEVSGNQIIWYRPIEPYIAPYVQIIGANNSLYVSTAKGLVSLNPDTGATNWIFATEMPLGNSPTYSNGVLYVGGFDKRLYAINANTGAKIWSYDGAASGYDTNPLVIGDTVYLGNRDGYFYAINTADGSLRWRYKTDGSITFSAAINTVNSRIYFASNDSYAYALNTDGSFGWKTKLPGTGFRNWWSVIRGDKVIFVSSTGYRQAAPGGVEGRDIQNLDSDGYNNNNHSDGLYNNPNTVKYSGPSGLTLVGPYNSASRSVEMTQVRNYLLGNSPYTSNPSRRTYFVLDAVDGVERINDAPMPWFGTRAGSRYPPIVGSDNTLYQSSSFHLKSQYELWGQIVGWRPEDPNYITLPTFSALGGDEPLGYSSGGTTIYWSACCDREAGAFKIDGSNNWIFWGYNLDTLAPGYDEMYWGEAEAGLNKLYGTYNGAYGEHGDQNPLIPYQGKLFVHRSNAILALGTRTDPVVHVPKLSFPSPQEYAPILTEEQLKNRLSVEVDKIIIAGHLRPAYTQSGNFDPYTRYGEILIDLWHNTGELLDVLSRAYPYLDPAMQIRLQAYLRSEYDYFNSRNFPEHNGWDAAAGTARELFTIPTEALAAAPNIGPYTSGTTWRNFSYYGLWKYALLTQYWGDSPTQVAQLAANVISSNKLGRPSSDTSQPYKHNASIAAMYGYRGLAQLAGNSTEENWANGQINTLTDSRISNFTKDVIGSVDQSSDYRRNIQVASNFMLLTPELANSLNASGAVSRTGGVWDAVDEYSWIAPYWFVPAFGATYGEGAIEPLYDVNSMFNSLAYITKPNAQRTAGTPRSREDLVKYIDSSATYVGDLYYIGNIVTALETPLSGASPMPSPTYVPFPTPTPTPTPLPSPSPTSDPTPTPSPTIDPSPIPSPTFDPTPSPSPDPSPTPTPTPSSSPSPLPSGITDTFDPVSETWSISQTAGVDDWTPSTARSQSPTHSYYATEPAVIRDARLTSEEFVVPQNAKLKFWHTYNMEFAADGGVIEISTNGGPFTDLGNYFLSGGYTGVINNDDSSPISPNHNRSAWTGGSLGAMTQVEVDLSSFAGQNAVVRFRMGSDIGTAGLGWYIDDVVVEQDDTVLVTLAVSSGADDVRQVNNKLTTSGTSTYLGRASSEENSYTGFRFANVWVPQGAEIMYAYVQVYVHNNNQSAQLTLIQYADDIGNSSQFSAGALPAERTSTTAQVYSTISGTWSGNTWNTLPDIASVVQEIVNRPDWLNGNAMSIIAANNGLASGRRTIRTYEGNSAQAARLIIRYR